MSNGYFSIQGYQVGTPASNRTNLGPFNMPFGPETNVWEYALVTGTLTIGVPAASLGVAIIPPIGAPPDGITLKAKTVSGDSGIFISTQQPTIIEWDTVNDEVPTSLYLVANGAITVTVQFL